MDISDILAHVDHTLLSPTATWEEIRRIVDEGINYRTASVCIPASYVRAAAEYAAGRVPVCTVIGFPNGYSTTEAKVFEAADAIRNGADEVDMVVDLGWVRDKRWDDVLAEIRALKTACGEKILKVIVETCLLTEEEKIKMCRLVSDSGADFIKTSTGFSKAGAIKEDVALFAKYVSPHVKIKAAGGISTLADAEDFLNLGALRLGTSRIVKLVKEL